MFYFNTQEQSFFLTSIIFKIRNKTMTKFMAKNIYDISFSEYKKEVNKILEAL